jgi:hypothetical protein
MLPRFSLFRARIALVALAFGLAACSGSTTSAVPSPSPSPLTGIAVEAQVIVKNSSPNCAWVTIYWSLPLLPWTIAGGDLNHPRFVGAGESFNFANIVIPQPIIPVASQIRVRAEVVGGGTCNGGQIADVQATNESLLPIPAVSSTLYVCSGISGDGRNFSVKRPESVSKDTKC